MKKMISTYFSDLSGAEIENGAPTVYFSFNGTSYEIDLTDAERAAFADSLAGYVAVARKVGGTRRASAKQTGPEPKAVRAWAKENGLDVPARGRIPAEISDAYNAAH